MSSKPDTNKPDRADPAVVAKVMAAPDVTPPAEQPAVSQPVRFGRRRVGGSRRWCTRQIQGEMAPSPKLLRDDRLATDGIRAPGRQHPVQHRHADGSLSLLGREAAGSQTRSDQRLVATHCRSTRDRWP